MWKKLLSENKTKKSLKSEVDSPDSPSFLGSAMNGNKNKNQKNDKNQIKNANPNPNREKREKRAIETIYFFTKSCQHFFSNYTKLSLFNWETKNIRPLFFYGSSYCCLLKTNKQKLYKTKRMTRKFKPKMNMKEIKSLTKNLELHIQRWH